MLQRAATHDPYAAAKAVTKKHAKSFYFASPFLPRQKRRDAYAVYALCRRLDDAVDEAPTPEAAELAVQNFGDTLDRVYGPAALEDDVLEAARQTAARCAIPRQYFDDLSLGCRMDLTVTRYANWESLERYCYRVAGVVGLIMCRVFDLRDRTAEPQAVAMGNAMQLTNICRDVKEDFERGRVYLPQSEMAAAGVTDGDLAAMTGGASVTDKFRRLIAQQMRRARTLYEEGTVGLAALPPDGSRQTAAVMAHVYGGILDVIEAADGDVFSQRRSTTLWQKLRRVPGAISIARRSGAAS